MRLDMGNALRDPGQSYPFAVELTVESLTYSDDPVSFENVRLEGELVGTGRGVALRAVLSADVISRCALCLEEARLQIETDMDNRFSRTPESEEEYLIEGYTADLLKPVTDALLLSLPIRFLCTPDCKGLCPVCGKNRNLHPCSCETGTPGEDEN